MMITEIGGKPRNAEASEGRGPSALSAATHRAYAGDLRDVEAWCRTQNIIGGLADLDERRIFAYIVDLVRKGRSPATVRRRLTALRGFAIAGSPLPAEASYLNPQQLFRLEKQVLTGSVRQTGVLVLSDDPITRAGLRVVLSESGVLCWSDTVQDADFATMTVWDYVLVWISTSRGIDPFSAIQRLRKLGLEITTVTPIVAISTTPLPLMVRLRLAEAGVRYALPHSWLSSNLGELSARLSSADIPGGFHLETPLALRQKLGLNLHGDLGVLLDAATLLPSEIWTGHRSQQHLPISRSEVQRMRRLALEGAGIPAPDFTKYASSLRTPPATPEWGKVREVVRAAFDL